MSMSLNTLQSNGQAPEVKKTLQPLRHHLFWTPHFVADILKECRVLSYELMLLTVIQATSISCPNFSFLPECNASLDFRMALRDQEHFEKRLPNSETSQATKGFNAL